MVLPTLSLVNVSILLLASIGLANIVVRKWHLFTCYLCSGFWSGLLLGWLWLDMHWQIRIGNLFACLVIALAASFLTELSSVVMNFLEVLVYGRSQESNYYSRKENKSH